jgi:Bacterial protein of unknown function (DUF899)
VAVVARAPLEEIEAVRKRTGWRFRWVLSYHSEDSKNLAEKKGLLEPDMKADLVARLKQDFDLGHGHSMVIWAVFKSKGLVEAPRKKKQRLRETAIISRTKSCTPVFVLGRRR